MEQETIAEVLDKLTAIKTDEEFERTMGQILGLDDGNSVTLQKHFFILLKQKKYLLHVCKGLKSNSFRTLQLVACVLTQILEHCTEDDLVLFAKTLFLDLGFNAQTKITFSKLLSKCSTGDQDTFNSNCFAEHFSTLAVSLNFLVSLVKKIGSVKGKFSLNDLTIDFMEIGMDCLKSCSHEEEVVLYAVELIECLLHQHHQLWLMLIHASYRIFFNILSLHPYEGLIIFFFIIIPLDPIETLESFQQSVTSIFLLYMYKYFFIH